MNLELCSDADGSTSVSMRTPAPPAPDATAVQELRGRLRGALIQAGDPAYEESRRAYSGMIDQRPALIARCVDVVDVIAAVTFAHQHGLPLTVRGGGHKGPGRGTPDDGLVVDLSPMTGIHVDPANRTARVAGGCTRGDVDHTPHPFGLVTPTALSPRRALAG